MLHRSIKHGVIVALSIATVVFFAACGGMPKPTFKNDPNGMLRVDNDLAQRLVFFAGLPARETYLGGVPGNVRDFGLATKTGTYVVTAVKVEDYMANRTNAAAMPIAWSRAVCVGEKPSRTIVNTILVGRGSVRFVNETAAFVEVRIGKWDGTNIVTLAPNETRVQKLPYRDYTLFPVRLDWRTNAGVITAGETRLSNSANMVGVLAREVTAIKILK